MNLDEKALDAAWDTLPHGSTLISRGAFKIAISTYLSSLPSSPVSELVDRLERRASTMNGSLVGASDGRTYALGYYNQLAAKDDKEAASVLTTLSTRNAELEREVKQLREVMQPFSLLAGEMFARGWDASNVALGFDGPAGPVHVTAGDFFAVRAALSTSPQGGEHE